MDWRTPPNPLQPSPFDAFYLSQSPSFLPRHASFQENEELLLIKGMTPGIYYGESLDDSQAGLRDCLSVYGSASAVDVNTASPPRCKRSASAPDDAQAIVQRRAAQPFASYQNSSSCSRQLGPAGQRLRLGGNDHVHASRHRAFETSRMANCPTCAGQLPRW